MATVTIETAKADLAALIETVRAGGEVVIAKGSEPVAKLVPVEGSIPTSRKFGALKGRISVDDTFFDPLPEAELQAWNDPD